MAFIKNLNDHLSDEGTVIFNKLVFNKEIKVQIPHIHDLYKEVFSNVELLTFMETGKIFVARKG
jgi:spermidine synthase